MLKKYRFYILLIFIISLVLYSNYRDYRYPEKRQFHIDHISLVDKIFLADRNGNTITLKKKSKSLSVRPVSAMISPHSI